CVTKEISPKKIFVPKLIKTDTPIAVKKNNGSIHELVDKTRIIIIIGTSKAAAYIVSVKAIFCCVAVDNASPVKEASSPMTSYTASVTATSSPLRMVNENKAAPSL